MELHPITVLVKNSKNYSSYFCIWSELHFLAPDKEFLQLKVLIFFLFLDENICCGYSLEAPHWGTFNEGPQHMFSSRNKKKYLSDTASNLELIFSSFIKVKLLAIGTFKVMEFPVIYFIHKNCTNLIG